jgi:hypothetical protein
MNLDYWSLFIIANIFIAVSFACDEIKEKIYCFIFAIIWFIGAIVCLIIK